jgi:acyl-CoA thioesterase FadM
MFENLYKDNPNYNFVIAHAEIDYLKPLYLEKIKIVCWVSDIGKTSFKIDYEIYNSKNEICAKGSTIQAMFDPIKKQKIEIDEKFKNYLTSFFYNPHKSS